jgi:hypothetical protein
LRISTSRAPEYRQIRMMNPRGVLLQFPNSILDFSEGEFRPPANEMVGFIRVAEISENHTTVSHIFIGLINDRPYELKADEGGLQIRFARDKTAASMPTGPPAASTGTPMDAQSVSDAPRPATRLKTITAATVDETLTITVAADGAIKAYKSFAIGNPPRIVFDFYKIRSPYSGEQIMSVPSAYVKQIRHCSHPDKLRWVLDIHNSAPPAYKSFPTPTGLLIQIEPSAK